MRRWFSIAAVMIGVVLLASSTSPAEAIFFKERSPADISSFSSGFDGLEGTAGRSLPFLGLPLGAYRLEGNFLLDQKKSSPIDIGKEKENVLSIQFSIRW